MGTRYRFNLTVTKNWSGTVSTITGTVDAVPYPPMPGVPRFRLKRQEGKMYYGVCDLPGPSASDVVTQELTVQVGTADPVVQSLPADAVVSDEIVAGEEIGVQVQMSLVDIDRAGNRSDPRVAQGTVTDTIAPPMPGELSFRVTRQD